MFTSFFSQNRQSTEAQAFFAEMERLPVGVVLVLSLIGICNTASVVAMLVAP
jgi:hypothetical protein